MKNTTQQLLIVILAVIAIAAVVFAIAANKSQAPEQPGTSNEQTNADTTNQPKTPASEAPQDKPVQVSLPQPNQLVTSPLTVSGQARGNWFFEASFPVSLKDANGKIIASGIATAQGEWMTTNFVPFTAKLTFANPTTNTGTLVLTKDNPSGLPENDDQLIIPVVFKK